MGGGCLRDMGGEKGGIGQSEGWKGRRRVHRRDRRREFIGGMETGSEGETKVVREGWLVIGGRERESSEIFF